MKYLYFLAILSLVFVACENTNTPVDDSKPQTHFIYCTVTNRLGAKIECFNPVTAKMESIFPDSLREFSYYMWFWELKSPFRLKMKISNITDSSISPHVAIRIDTTIVARLNGLEGEIYYNFEN
ncbi:MAG TPA: hypothetical protein VHP30_10705 [Ignavibacteriales bacterium]|nr:hypothetical protein [Ignavibacteriales bacterium]